MNDDKPQAMATYRLQFNQDFRFEDAQSLVPYFSRLGVTHIYASPVLRAKQASTHGYDVVDPKTINPNLGDKTDLIRLTTDLHKFGLALVIDIVPNHMAASIENPYWRDVLTYGHSSPFAGWFDIDWRMPDPDMWGRVLVPVLGEPRARAIEQGKIQLSWQDGRFLVHYYEHIFPVDPSTVPVICDFGLQELEETLPSDHSALDKIREILAYLKKLPNLVARLRRRVDIDREETEQWLAQFAQVVVQSPRIEQWAEETARRFGEGPQGQRRLTKLLDKQPYRLVYWRAAARTINYRRFFDINELISIRQEDPHVFVETHSAVLRWAGDGLIDGLRIDHIDGLRDPLGYLERLSEALASEERSGGPVVIFVEKILAPGEPLPAAWPVEGTTGYEFLNQAEALFVHRDGFARIEQEYRRLLRRPVQFEQIAIWGKRRVLHNDLSPQVGRLADILLRLAETRNQSSTAASPGTVSTAVAKLGHLQQPVDIDELGVTATLVQDPEGRKRDFVDAIVEVVAALPVYRTYVDSHHRTLSDADRRFVETALNQARQSGRAAPEAIDFLGEVLLLEDKFVSEHELDERVTFLERFQQLTGPAAAKGIEDTALYAYVPLVSLNEVGGEPHVPDDAALALHRANESRAASHPRTMLCVTTHDTKRTADVRARLDVLSEFPKLWTGLVRRWRRLNEEHRTRVGGKRVPDAPTEYLFYQTVVGLWPAPQPDRAEVLPSAEVVHELRGRIEGYMTKAIREAKIHTAWTKVNQPYEDAVTSFVRSLLLHEGSESAPFLSDVQHLVSRVARPGFWNSLSRTLVQFASPGTPDLYQGDELWNFALVDPDNRRPVDFETRQALLDQVITAAEGHDDTRLDYIRKMVAHPEDGRIKLHLIHSLLAARREDASLFASGDYFPLMAEGPGRDHVLTFARESRTKGSATGSDSRSAAAITLAPRLTTTLPGEPNAAPVGEAAWSDTVVRLPDHLRRRAWTCAVTGRQVRPEPDGGLRVSQALETFPGALLISGQDMA